MTQPGTMHEVRFYPLIFPVTHSSRGRLYTRTVPNRGGGGLGTHTENAVSWAWVREGQPASLLFFNPRKNNTNHAFWKGTCLLNTEWKLYKFLIPWHWKYGDRLFWIFGDECIRYTTCPQFSCGEGKKNMASRITRSSSIGQKASLHKQLYWNSETNESCNENVVGRGN